MKGFCTRSGFPRELPWLSCLEPQVIIQRYNAVLLGLSNFYSGHIRNRAAMHRWISIDLKKKSYHHKIFFDKFYGDKCLLKTKKAFLEERKMAKKH